MTLATKNQANKRAGLWTRINRILFEPPVSIVETGIRQRAWLLSILSLFTVIIFAGSLIVNISTKNYSTIPPFILVTIIGLAVYLFSRGNYPQIGSFILTSGISLMPTFIILATRSNAIMLQVFFMFVPLSMILGIAFLKAEFLAFIGAINIASIILVPILLGTEMYEGGHPEYTLVIVVLVAIATTYFRQRIENMRLQEVNQANRNLQEIKNELETRVNERTLELTERAREAKEYLSRMEKRAAQFRAITEVTRAAASIRELETLLPTITQVIARQFGFYHVGIFFIDPDKEFAILQAANSEGGQRMLERGHKLRVGETGIVGFVASRGVPRIVLDVGDDAVFFNNPDLPGTRSEMALPLKSSGKTIGVLDVQSELPSAFTQEDIAALSTLADQVGIAIDNARLFESTQKALADAQAYYQQFIRMEWKSLSTEERTLGFRLEEKQVEVLQEPAWNPEIESALASGKTVRSEATTGSGTQTVAIPVKLRDEVIGVLNIRSKSQKGYLRDDEINMAETVADQVALALENARLLGGAQKRAAKERTIGEIASRLSTSISLDNILQTTVEELGRVLPGSEVIIQLQSSENSNGAEK
jgi:GAF domain-containing protein